ncbi:unnamed protein product [Musa hybrid cultivar]
MGRASCCGIRKKIKAVLFCWLVVNTSVSMEAAAAAVSLGTTPVFVSKKPIKCLHLEAKHLKESRTHHTFSLFLCCQSCRLFLFLCPIFSILRAARGCRFGY